MIQQPNKSITTSISPCRVSRSRAEGSVARTLCRIGAPSALVLLLGGCLYFSTDYQVNYGLNHYEMGLYNQAIPPLVTAAPELEKSDPPDRRAPTVLIALGNMAESKARNDLAEDFFRRALKAAERLDQSERVLRRNALVHLGLFYSNHERALEGQPLLERALEISEREPERYFYAIDLDNLALTFQRLNRYADADRLSLKALAVLDALPAGAMESRTRGTIFHNLAYSYMEQRRHAAAEPLFRKSLDLLEAGSPKDVERWRIRTVLRNYAKLLRQTGREAEARALEGRVDQFR